MSKFPSIFEIKDNSSNAPCIDDDGTIIFESSQLGFDPGVWPEYIISLRKSFQRKHFDLTDSGIDVAGFWYESNDGEKILIIND